MNRTLLCHIARVYLLIASTGAPAGAELRRDIEYGRHGDEPLLLDASIPEGSGPFPIAILIHGGGWQRGDKAGSDRPGDPADITPWFVPFTEARFAWFSINYRLLPRHPWPAAFEDAQAAVRWIRAHAAEFKGDPARIAVVGHSAGGHIAALLATNSTRDSRVGAAVLFAPATDSPPPPRRPSNMQPRLVDTLHAPPGMSPEAFSVTRLPWPVDHVTARMPPVLIVQGTDDGTVPLSRSVTFIEKLQAARVPHEWVHVAGAPHSLIDLTKRDPGCMAAVTTWLQRTLATVAEAPPPAADAIVAPDGTGDFTTIQAAIDAAPEAAARRWTILMREGVYRENLRLHRPEIALVGESRDRTRIVASESAPAGAAAVTATANDCAIENLSIDHLPRGGGAPSAAIAVHGVRLTMSDCDVTSSGICAILQRGAARIRLARLTVRSTQRFLSADDTAAMTDTLFIKVPAVSRTPGSNH